MVSKEGRAINLSNSSENFEEAALLEEVKRRHPGCRGGERERQILDDKLASNS